MDDRTTVLVHCCNRLLRELITRVLGKRTEFAVQAYDGRIRESLGSVFSSSADVVVLDCLELFLQGTDTNYPNIARVRQQEAKYVLVAMEDDQEKFLSAVRRGALGYVLQDASAADVVSAIRTVARGQASCPPAYSRVLFDCVAGRSDDSQSSRRRTRWGLTRREQQLIPLIGRGLTNKEIAAQLSLSERTIKNHIHRILKKVGVSDRLDLCDVWQSRIGPSGRGTIAN